MPVDLPLAQMSLEDKLQAMELLWAELSKTPDQVISPTWHSDVLQRRRDQAQQGRATFHSWDSAIGELRTELGGHQAP